MTLLLLEYDFIIFIQINNIKNFLKVFQSVRNSNIFYAIIFYREKIMLI